MTELDTPVTPDLRGLVLVAHYAFRKEIGSRGGHEKSASAIAAAKHRETQSASSLYDMLHHTTLMSAVNKAAQYVGSPGEVPDQNFTQFLQQKLGTLHAAYNMAFQEMTEAAAGISRPDPATEPDKKALQALAHSQAKVEAHSYVLNTFVRLFSPVLRELAGA